MAYVIGLVHGGGDAYGISYPDFPGCVAGGASLDDAVSRGEDALAVHVESMLEDDEELPALRSRDEILKDAELQDEIKDAVLVAVPMPSTKRARVHVMIDESLLAAVDRSAEAEGFTRSGYFERAVRDRLKRRASSDDSVSCVGQTAFLAHPVAMADLQAASAPGASAPEAEDNAQDKWQNRLRTLVERRSQSEAAIHGVWHEALHLADMEWNAEPWSNFACMSCDALHEQKSAAQRLVLFMEPVATQSRPVVVGVGRFSSKVAPLNKAVSK